MEDLFLFEEIIIAPTAEGDLEEHCRVDVAGQCEAVQVVRTGLCGEEDVLKSSG